MARKQDSPEVATEKALAFAEYEAERRRALDQLARLREERMRREAKTRQRTTARK